MVKSSEVTTENWKVTISSMSTTSKTRHSRFCTTLLWSVHKPSSTWANNNPEDQDSSTLKPQSWVMPRKLPWSSFINHSRTSTRPELFTHTERIKTAQTQRCPSTQPTSMLCQLSDNKVLITIMLLTLRVPQKRFGNIAEESCIKENTNLLMLRKTRSSRLSTWGSVRTVKECWDLACCHSTRKSSTKTSISTPAPQITLTSHSKIIFSSVWSHWWIHQRKACHSLSRSVNQPVSRSLWSPVINPQPPPPLLNKLVSSTLRQTKISSKKDLLPKKPSKKPTPSSFMVIWSSRLSNKVKNKVIKFWHPGAKSHKLCLPEQPLLKSSWS